MCARNLPLLLVAATCIAGAGRAPERAERKGELRRDTGAFPVRATAGFVTGMVTLATVAGRVLQDETAQVDWGDGTTTPALFGECNLRGCNIMGSHVYVQPDTYPIMITFSRPRGEVETLSTEATVVPPGEFVILSIGDSVASGEGSPVVSKLDGPIALWDDTDPNSGESPCHRSSLAGPALAARRVAEANEDVTFVHAACSGAKTPEIIDQLSGARGKLGRIDVLIISGGANNIAGGFGNLISCCIEVLDCNLLRSGGCADNATLVQRVADDIAALQDDYAELARAIDDCLKRDRNGELVPDPACDLMEQPVPSSVIITEYFDPTHDKWGRFPGHVSSTSCAAHLVKPAEWEFLYNHMVIPLNDAVAAAAKAHGWILVDGFEEQFLEHGYCASAGPGSAIGGTWIVKVPESLRLQGDTSGTGHPNIEGQEVYADAIHAVLAELVPTGAAAGRR